MAYASNITRGTAPSYTSGSNGANALIPDDVANSIIDGVIEKSACLSLFPHVPMPTGIHRMPVLATLPDAFWINGDTGLVQTSQVTWRNKFLNAEELGVIVPIPKKVMEDASFDLWKIIKPRIEEAIALKLDSAILFGLDKPSSWPQAVAVAAIAAGNTVTRGASSVDFLDDINNVYGKVEASGFDVNGAWYKLTLKADMRGARDSNKGLIFQPRDTTGVADAAFTGHIWGVKATTTKLGAFEAQTGANQIHLIAGDFTQGMIGIRKDLDYMMLDQAVIQDDQGNIAYNLPQQGMVAMMVTARYAWQVSNPINRIKALTADGAGAAETVVSGDRYPFAVLRHSS